MTTDAEEGPWITEEALCDWCGYEWVAIHPCAMTLECPQCHQLSPSTFNIECSVWEAQQEA